VANNKQIYINKSNKKYKFIYIDDVIDVILNFCHTKEFNFLELSTDNSITIPELAKIIKSFKSLKSKESILSELLITEKFYNQLFTTYKSFK
jgi:nucleoside-diphosphate-sugar epimerase